MNTYTDDPFRQCLLNYKMAHSAKDISLARHKTRDKLQTMFKNALLATLALFAGMTFGLALLEASLHLNPRLLLRGMAVPAPVDPPVL